LGQGIKVVNHYPACLRLGSKVGDAIFLGIWLQEVGFVI
jgi:hypothetical protein